MAKALPVTPTLLNKYLTCPYQYKAQYITKEIKFVTSPHIEWGNRVHTAMENALKLNQPLPEDVQFMSPLIDVVRFYTAQGYTLCVEHELAINEQMVVTDWRNGAIRAKMDVLLYSMEKNHAIVIDWKTGKPKDDPLQAKISALLVRCCLNISEVNTMWVHVKPEFEEVIHGNWTLETLEPVAEVFANIQEYKQACKSDQFPPKPNGLCKSWCDALSCPNNGKRT